MWGAYLTYQTANGKQHIQRRASVEGFEIRFHKRTAAVEPGQQPLSVYLSRWHQASYASSHTFGGADGTPATRYAVYIRAGDPKPKGRVVPDAEVIDVLASPEAMRDYLLVGLRELDKKVEAEVTSGAGIGQASLADPPKGASKPEDYRSARKITPEERTAVVAAARKEVARQMEAVRTEYKEMYQAYEKTFPLRDILLETKGTKGK